MDTYYLENSQCFACENAVDGCDSCDQNLVCSSCKAEEYTLVEGKCVNSFESVIILIVVLSVIFFSIIALSSYIFCIRKPPVPTAP